MISFENDESNYLELFHTINNTEPDNEYECVFGLDLPNFGGDKNTITYTKFTNLLKKLKQEHSNPGSWKLIES